MTPEAKSKDIEGFVKWWSPAKRYGFITFGEGDAREDALLPLAMLNDAGCDTLATGAQCKAHVEKTEKGWVVRKLYETGIPDITKMGGVAATVKWYSSEAGYGFVIPHNVAEEIFIHASVLKNAGLDIVNPGQPVTVLMSETVRGKRVTMIALREAAAAPAS